MRILIQALRRRQAHWLLLAALCSAATSAAELMVLRETGIASLLRPAPGVIFLAALCLGWRGALVSTFGIGVAYVLSVGTGWPIVFQSPLSPVAAAILIFGIGVQAMAQVWLLRRFEVLARPRLHPLTGILVVAPIGCLISASCSTAVLYWQHGLAELSVMHFWLVAYTGSVLGVTVIYPLAWLLDRQINDQLGRRRPTGLAIAVTAIIAGTWLLTTVLLLSSIALERGGISQRFDDSARALRDEAEDMDLLAIGLQAVFRHEDVEPQVFGDLAGELLARDPTLVGMLLARIDAGRIVVDRATSAAIATQLQGLALSSEPAIEAVLAEAGPNTRVRLSSLSRIVDGEQGSRLLAWMIPLRPGAGERPGFLLLLQNPRKLVQWAIGKSEALPARARVQLSDVTAGGDTPLFTGDQQGLDIERPQATRYFSQNEIRSRQQIQIAGRLLEWRVSLPSTAYTFSLGWWIVQITVQLLGAALAMTLVISVNRRDTLREMDQQLAVLSRRYLNFERTLALPTGSMSAARMQPPVDSRDAVLLKAFQNGEFQQFYEPVVSLSGGEIVGFESLLRWPDAPFRIAIPEIIAWAERSHHVHALTLRTLRQAIECIERWKTTPGGRTWPWISINVSPEDVADIAFMEQLMDLFRRHPLARRQIKLEITEGVLVRDFKGVAQRLRWVRDQGMGISLDDFGTGYSSLSYLHQLPVDSIKIDRSFIAGVDTDPRVREIVQATVELAHRLKIDIVAEGVEQQATVRYLEGIGCQAAQGWLFAKAQPSVVIDEWVRSGHRFAVSDAAATV